MQVWFLRMLVQWPPPHTPPQGRSEMDCDACPTHVLVALREHARTAAQMSHDREESYPNASIPIEFGFRSIGIVRRAIAIASMQKWRCDRGHRRSSGQTHQGWAGPPRGK